MHVWISVWKMHLGRCADFYVTVWKTRCRCCSRATNSNTLQHTTTHCNTLQYTATNCNTLQRTATHCNTLQHTATHCNTLQHTATHRNTIAAAVEQHTLSHIHTHTQWRTETSNLTRLEKILLEAKAFRLFFIANWYKYRQSSVRISTWMDVCIYVWPCENKSSDAAA